MKPPRVFISYSHDSAQHKEWVLNLATTLRERGVDTVLDQWDLKPGDDLPHFMDTELANSDYALMICSERYVKKANDGEGGVGYEKMIMTSSLLNRIHSSKVIPILRNNNVGQVPTFMLSKLYVDFRNDSDVEYNLDELLRTLLNSPLYEKPKIGSSPFKPMNEAKPDRISDGTKEAMRTIADAFNNTSTETLSIANIFRYTSMHRLTLERYLISAIKDELLFKNTIGYYSVTGKGIEYLVEHSLIDA
jgi:hypothetical protein